MFRIEPSTTLQGAYDVCNKEAVRHDLETVISRLYSDHRAGACNCRGTARETYLGDGDLVWRRGSTCYSSINECRTAMTMAAPPATSAGAAGSAAAAAGASAHRQRQQWDSARVVRADV